MTDEGSERESIPRAAAPAHDDARGDRAGRAGRAGRADRGDRARRVIRAGRTVGRFAGRRVWPVLAAAVASAGDPDRTRRRQILGIEVVLAFDLTLTAIVLSATYNQLGDENLRGGRPFDDFHLLVAAALLAAPAALRDRSPRLAWGMSLLAAAWASGVATTLMPPLPYLAGGVIVFLYCQYTVAARADTGRALTTPWAISVGVGALLYPPGWPVSTILATIPLVLGMNVRSHRYAQRRLAEQERRHREERAVLEERQRIARELHDVVAHHMSVIAIQAEAAPYRVADPPRELTDSLAGIRANALEGLTELRRVLGVLRADQDGGQTAPQPGPERMHELVGNARDAGLTVRVKTTGRPRPLAPGAGLSAYRILQEALSNVMRHAPRSSVHVRLDYTTTALRIEVRNGPSPEPGRAAAGHGSGHGSGHGLAGMRERAAMMGGEMSAAPAPGGGYAVEATLPLPDLPLADPALADPALADDDAPAGRPTASEPAGGDEPPEGGKT